MNKVYLGVGCFWGAQKYYDQIKGIKETNVAYINGGFVGVSYKEVCASSGHVEVVEVIYDNNLISKQELFESFIRVIDPFSKNKQGEDIGIQYRTGIYVQTNKEAEEFKNILSVWEKEHGKSEVEIALVQDITLAEEYHQNYLDKNPTGYCHINYNDVPNYLKK